MMAQSKCSNQRPDTLMQDRICQVDETSCNARPDHTFGSIASFWPLADDFRSSPGSGHCHGRSACLKMCTEPDVTQSFVAGSWTRSISCRCRSHWSGRATLLAAEIGRVQLFSSCHALLGSEHPY